MYDLNQFSDNGVSWPFNINDLTGKNLLDEYFNFQAKAQSIMKKNITLKPNLLSKFFDNLCFKEEILHNVRKLIGNDIYTMICKIIGQRISSIF